MFDQLILIKIVRIQDLFYIRDNLALGRYTSRGILHLSFCIILLDGITRFASSHFINKILIFFY